MQPRPQNAAKKKQLSIALNKKGLLKEASDRSKKLDAERTADMADHNYEKAEPHFNCTKQASGNCYVESKKGTPKPLPTECKEKRLSKINDDFKETRNDMKNSVTRLDLDCMDSTSETNAVLNDDLSSKREKNGLISRKSTVKSDRPMTKPVLLRKHISVNISASTLIITAHIYASLFYQHGTVLYVSPLLCHFLIENSYKSLLSIMLHQSPEKVPAPRL